MNIRTRNEHKLTFTAPLTQEKAIAEMTGEEDSLWWKDLYVEPDIIEGESDFIYIVDTHNGRVYYGYTNNRTFQREEDQETEQKLLEELGFIDKKQEIK